MISSPPPPSTTCPVYATTATLEAASRLNRNLIRWHGCSSCLYRMFIMHSVYFMTLMFCKYVNLNIPSIIPKQGLVSTRRYLPPPAHTCVHLHELVRTYLFQLVVNIRKLLRLATPRVAQPPPKVTQPARISPKYPRHPISFNQNSLFAVAMKFSEYYKKMSRIPQEIFRNT